MSNLFTSWTFEGGSLGLGGLYSNTAISPKNNGGMATLHEPTIKALWWYAKAILKPDEAEIAVGEGENAYTGEIFTCVEKVDGSETVLIVRNSDKTIAAAIYDGVQTKPYMINKSRKDGAEIICTIIPLLLDDEFFKDKFEEFKSYLVDGINIIDISDLQEYDSIKDILFVLCDHIYRSIELDRLIVMGKIPQQLSLESIKDGTYTPSKVYVGEFRTLEKKSCSEKSGLA